MTAVLILFAVQCVLGAFDNFWHHELEADLPHEPDARGELALHSAREFIYAVVFAGIAWAEWNGAWTWLLCGLLATEIVITVWDFLVEDRTRKLPPLERVLHTVLALNYGVLLGMWAPVLLRWAHQPTGFTAVDYGLASWLLTAAGAGVFVWSMRNLLAVARLGVPQWKRAPLHAGPASGHNVLVTGGTGFVGRALVRRLTARGDHVIVLSRNAARARDRFGPLVEVCSDLRNIDAARRIHAIVNLAGEPIAGGPWTAARKQRFLDSRLDTTRALNDLAGRLLHKPQVLVSASAVGYYGDRGDAVLDERTAADSSFMAQLCRRWEDEAARAAVHGLRVCTLRIGIVLGADGGVLAPMALGTRLGGGVVLGSGAQWMPWIHQRDLLRMIEWLIDDRHVGGPVNAVAPQALTQRQFTRELARVLHRPMPWRVPAGLLRTMLGGMSALFLDSARVQPRRATEAGFAFMYPELGAALDDLYAPQPAVRATVIHSNEDCVVCHTEMEHYRRIAGRNGFSLPFCPIERNDARLARYGLADTDMRKRLYVQTEDGSLRSGIDAFALMWKQLPGYRWLGWLATRWPMRPVLHAVYDLVLAPMLTLWNRRQFAVQAVLVGQQRS